MIVAGSLKVLRGGQNEFEFEGRLGETHKVVAGILLTRGLFLDGHKESTVPRGIHNGKPFTA